jgi:hypothetical protein|tara:strand:- start:167 stop:427 length:261 start_codon:yes stop_codon:yes gene_type:complete
MFEFIIGGVFGVYFAQSCILPNLQEAVTNWILNRNGPITIPPSDNNEPAKEETKEEKEGTFTGEMPKVPIEIEMTRLGTAPSAQSN